MPPEPGELRPVLPLVAHDEQAGALYPGGVEHRDASPGPGGATPRRGASRPRRLRPPPRPRTVRPPPGCRSASERTSRSTNSASSAATLPRRTSVARPDLSSSSTPTRPGLGGRVDLHFRRDRGVLLVETPRELLLQEPWAGHDHRVGRRPLPTQQADELVRVGPPVLLALAAAVLLPGNRPLQIGDRLDRASPQPDERGVAPVDGGEQDRRLARAREPLVEEDPVARGHRGFDDGDLVALRRGRACDGVRCRTALRRIGPVIRTCFENPWNSTCSARDDEYTRRRVRSAPGTSAGASGSRRVVEPPTSSPGRTSRAIRQRSLGLSRRRRNRPVAASRWRRRTENSGGFPTGPRDKRVSLGRTPPR